LNEVNADGLSPLMWRKRKWRRRRRYDEEYEKEEVVVYW
jgi:hypothetical protein